MKTTNEIRKACCLQISAKLLKKIRQVLHTCLIKANYQYFEYKEEIKEAQTLTTSHLEGNQNRRFADSDFFSFQKFEFLCSGV